MLPPSFAAACQAKTEATVFQSLKFLRSFLNARDYINEFGGIKLIDNGQYGERIQQSGGM